MGTQEHFNHLIGPHVEMYNYNLESIFRRWYADPAPPLLSLRDLQFEVDWGGNVWLPENLLFGRCPCARTAATYPAPYKVVLLLLAHTVAVVPAKKNAPCLLSICSL